MRKTSDKPTLGAMLRGTLECQGHDKTRKDQEAITDKKRLRRYDN